MKVAEIQLPIGTQWGKVSILIDILKDLKTNNNLKVESSRDYARYTIKLIFEEIPTYENLIDIGIIIGMTIKP